MKNPEKPAACAAVLTYRQPAAHIALLTLPCERKHRKISLVGFQVDREFEGLDVIPS